MAKRRAKAAATVSDTLREAVNTSGQTLYRVAKDSGVPYATLYRFITHGRAVSMENLDRLCAYLGLKLTR
jgi:predicted transcriptional regulator